MIDSMIKYVSENAPIKQPVLANEVANAAAFLVSPLANGITGTVLYVDKGYHVMGMSVTDQNL